MKSVQKQGHAFMVAKATSFTLRDCRERCNCLAIMLHASLFLLFHCLSLKEGKHTHTHK